MAGNAAGNLADSKNPLDIGIQALAEGHLNRGDQADYMQYLRDAKLMSRAEQLMTARGGSESMANANAFLARGGAHAPEETVRAAEKSRKALFGELGAVMQVLSPDQAAKLNAGLQALMNDDPKFDYAAVGQELAPAIARAQQIVESGGANGSGGGRGGRGATAPFNRAQWLQTNPPLPNETPAQYQARLNAAAAGGG
jgi:hypothetical protein